MVTVEDGAGSKGWLGEDGAGSKGWLGAASEHEQLVGQMRAARRNLCMMLAGMARGSQMRERCGSAGPHRSVRSGASRPASQLPAAVHAHTQ